MIENPREAVIRALYKIECDGAYSQKALSDGLRNLQPVDRAFATELFMGVLRNKLYLDFIIKAHSKLKIKKLSPWVLQILRAGVYQLIFMDKVPPSAACNESVKLAVKYAHSAARGFVNGMLRSISRKSGDLPMPGGSAAEKMSVLYSCPLWLAEKLENQFGTEKCRQILKDSLLPHQTTIRVNKLKTSGDELMSILASEGVSSEQGDIIECLKINGAIDISGSQAYKSGLYTLQNINSMRAVKTLGPMRGETIIDVCAAPGGKTTHIAELMGNDGRVIAFDIHRHKLELIERAARRLGISCIETSEYNSENVSDRYIGLADRVLADVPCSGIGVIHKKPEIKYNRKPEDIDDLCKIQRNILDASAKYVKPGGVLLYSTCTILKEENSVQTAEFLSRNAEFEKESEQLLLSDETGGSGFYICKMKRRG